jgi:pyridoxal/pyridoxine/pyridoxamine kinase
LDNYCFNAEQRKDYSKNINYNKMMEDVTNQLIVYETAKMNNDIQNSVYNADSTGVDGFANELNYFNSLNWLLYAGLGDTISSDKNTSLKEKQDESKILCDSIDKFVETMKNRYQFKYGEEASAKMNAILEQLPMSFTRNYYSGNGEYVYYIANKTNSSSKETASDVDEGKTK